MEMLESRLLLPGTWGFKHFQHEWQVIENREQNFRCRNVLKCTSTCPKQEMATRKNIRHCDTLQTLRRSAKLWTTMTLHKSLKSLKTFWQSRAYRRGRVKAEQLNTNSQVTTMNTHRQTEKVHVYARGSVHVFNDSYLSEVQGDVHLVVLGAAGQRRALPPSLRPVDGVGDGMGAIAVLAADVTVLALRGQRERCIKPPCSH